MFVFFKRDAALHAKLAKVARSAKSHYLKLKELIMATQAETAQELRAITAQNEKARVEILAKIKVLEDALATAGNTSAEVAEAVAALRASVQLDDDMVPDVPTP